jgi:hypothetical protein
MSSSQPPPYPPQPGYGQPYPPDQQFRPTPKNGMGTAALVLGILAVVLAFVPILGFVSYPLAIIGIVLGLVGLGRVRKRVATNRGVTLAGMIASVLGLVLVIASTMLWVSAIGAGVEGANKAINAPHNVTYKVTTTNGGDVSVTYSQGAAGSGSGSAIGVPSPWTVDTSVTGSSALLTASAGVDIQDPNKAEGLTCEIVDRDTGKSVVTNSVPPSPGASVTCSTFSLGS